MRNIIIIISSITFDRRFYGKYFLYNATQLIETNRLVYNFFKTKKKPRHDYNKLINMF